MEKPGLISFVCGGVALFLLIISLPNLFGYSLIILYPHIVASFVVFFCALSIIFGAFSFLNKTRRSDTIFSVLGILISVFALFFLWRIFTSSIMG